MAVEKQKRDIAFASRILADLEILDAFGHVSARDASQPDAFLMSRSLAPKLVRDGDVLKFDFDGRARSHSGTRLFLERFLHAEIYRSRPDVQAIVHSHAPSVLPFTVSRTEKLVPVSHLCGFLHGLPEVFDLADQFGPDTNLLISDAQRGKSLAAHMRDASVILMRGHGFTVIGQTIQQATFRAYYLSRNCEAQWMARQLGEVVSLSAAEARACEEATNSQSSRAWDLWVSDLQTRER
jgi:ribulose-5-phosphate 4-epimerase/fuculose-1-phosphate aldolase